VQHGSGSFVTAKKMVAATIATINPIITKISMSNLLVKTHYLVTLLPIPAVVK